jgi:hypothetical protein
MAIWRKSGGKMRKVLAATLAIFVLLLPAPSLMALQCNDVQETVADHSTNISASVAFKSNHETETETCCKVSCVVISAVAVPIDFMIFRERSNPKFADTSTFLADRTSPPLRGPPRTLVSTI